VALKTVTCFFIYDLRPMAQSQRK